MSDEEVPLQSNDEDNQQSNIHRHSTMDNVDTNTTAPNVHENDEEIQVTDNTDARKTDHDETQNLINDNGNDNIAASSTSVNNDFVGVTVEMNNNPDNDTKNNDIDINTDQSKNEYIDHETKQNDNNETERNINNIQNDLKNNNKHHLHSKLSSDNIQAQISPVSTASTVSHNFSVDSIGSEPLVSNANDTIKARILTTWVPKTTLASELTVIAGDTVTIIHSEAIQLVDNPLAVFIDKIIILNTIHWTQIQQRSGKIGVVPSNILCYAQNPINDVWTKVKIQHSFMAKAPNQLSISAHERLQIYGCVDEDDMITAQSKDGSQGLIPYNFVEIPTAQKTNDALHKNGGQSPHFRTSAGSISSGQSDEYPENTTQRSTISRSRHSSIDRVHHPQTSSLKFVIDDTITNLNSDGASSPSVNAKNLLTSKIKAIGSSISTAIDKIQYASYSHGAGKTLVPIPTAANQTALNSPSAKSHSTTDRIRTPTEDIDKKTVKYEWNAPLQWKKVYILRDFGGTQTEIELVYQAFILDKQSRGRNESILSYSAPSDENHVAGVAEEYFDPFNVAAPSKAKKTEKDVLSFQTTDMIEVTGSPSPEGWILARFCNEKQRKGFVAMSYLQEVETQTPGDVSSGISVLLQQHTLNSQPKLDEIDDAQNDEVVAVAIATSPSQSSPVMEDDMDMNNFKNRSNINIKNAVDEQLDSGQPLPFHWPFSTYPVKKRSQQSKIIESVILFILFIIYLLPVLIEEPKPENAPKKYNIWWINLFLVCLPWSGIFLLRMLELWGKIFSVEENPNNKLYATLLFYIILIFYFFGLFAIVIEFRDNEWIRDNSPVLFMATIVEILVFITCVSLIILAILFILIWTFCCRIVRNRYETRIEFYCCTKGQPARTKRYPRTQK